MTDEKLIMAGVVTFNRKELLSECLTALRKQTTNIGLVVVVDNDSTDGTSEFLLDTYGLQSIQTPAWLSAVEHGALAFDGRIEVNGQSTQLLLLKLASNIGGAGGFHMLQSAAEALGASWLWMMDDDGKPKANCLESLLAFSEARKVKVINPLVVDSTESARLAFGLSSNITTVKDALEKADADYFIPKLANPFNGTLMECSIFKEIGLIKKEMFIWGDESEYFRRCRSRDISVGTLVSALHIHPPSKSVIKKFLFGLLSLEAKPAHLEMNFYRNHGFLAATYGKFYSHRFIAKVILFYVLKCQLQTAITAYRYYVDGARDRYLLPVFHK